MCVNFDERLKTIGGSFSPDQMSIFLNMQKDELGENYRVYFHERFHHWQFLFTPYGHLRWGCIRSASAEIIEAWSKVTETTKKQRLLPVGNLLEHCDKDSLGSVLAILTQNFALTLLNYHERYYENKDVTNRLRISKDDVCPKILLRGREYYLNGLDIIESFTKFQEAVFCETIDNTPFYKTLDCTKLNPEYYSAFSFFLEQLGSNRILEFPVICEIALATNKLCKFDNSNISWRNNHPAWRYVKLITVLKEHTHSLPSLSDNIKENFVEYWNAVTSLCGFQDYRTMWDSAIDYAQSSELSMAKDMKRAIDFKLQHPWFLAFPLLDSQLLENSELHDLRPYYLIFSDTAEYFIDDKSIISEIIFEGHFQALSNQIAGKMSKRCVYTDLLQCGFSYYGFGGCKYLTDGLCEGHFDKDHRVEKIEFDKAGNVIQGCPFECFLLTCNINPNEIAFSNICDQASFLDVAKKIQELNV